jgi:hypothetical protein
MGRLIVTPLVVLALLTTPAIADDNSITIHTGVSGASKGYPATYSAGAFVDWYDGAFGFHGDFDVIRRHDEGGYGAVGLSYALTDEINPNVTVGTSTKGNGLLPEFLLAGSVKITPADGWIVTPGITYRVYDSGDTPETRHRAAYEEAVLGFVHYFTVPFDHSGYWAFQSDNSVSFNGKTADPWSARLGLQTVRDSGWRFGAGVQSGFMAWDPQTGARDVQSRVWSAGGNIGFQFDKGPEISLILNHAHNSFYDTNSATVTLRFTL